jgi:hypothetical protein
MFRTDHEKWIDVPFWLAWMMAGALCDFFSIFIVMFLGLLNIPTASLAVIWLVLIFVPSFIYTVLTRTAHKRWLEKRKREMEKVESEVER